MIQLDTDCDVSSDDELFLANENVSVSDMDIREDSVLDKSFMNAEYFTFIHNYGIIYNN